MEYCPLGDLKKYLLDRGNDISLAFCQNKAFQIANGVRFLHDAKVI